MHKKIASSPFLCWHQNVVEKKFKKIFVSRYEFRKPDCRFGDLSHCHTCMRYMYIFHLSEWVVNDMHVVGTTLAYVGNYMDNCGCAHRDTFAKLGFWKFGGDGEFNWKT
jgi:hypothetical protein